MPTVSLNRIIPLLNYRKFNHILDYGAGTFHNSRFLANQGFSVLSIDKPKVVNKFARLYSGDQAVIIGAATDGAFKEISAAFDAVICTFVLNLLDWPTNKYLAELFAQKVHSGGIILVEVKERRRGEDKKALTLPQLDRLFIGNGFCRISYFRGRRSIGAVYEKF